MTLVVSAAASASSAFALPQATPSSSIDRTPFFAAGLEQLVANSSQSRLLLATTRSSDRFAHLTEVSNDDEAALSNRADDNSSNEQMTNYWSDNEDSAATDEVFESLGDILQLASM